MNTTTTIIENDIPIETLFKFAIKERKQALKELDKVKEDYEFLKKENDKLRKKIPAYNIDGSFVSQRNYELMANERSKALENCEIYMSRLYAKDNEIKRLKKVIADKDKEIEEIQNKNIFKNIAKIFC